MQMPCPAFDPLRNNPSFKETLATMGFLAQTRFEKVYTRLLPMPTGEHPGPICIVGRQRLCSVSRLWVLTFTLANVGCRTCAANPPRIKRSRRSSSAAGTQQVNTPRRTEGREFRDSSVHECLPPSFDSLACRRSNHGSALAFRVTTIGREGVSPRTQIKMVPGLCLGRGYSAFSGNPHHKRGDDDAKETRVCLEIVRQEWQQVDFRAS